MAIQSQIATSLVLSNHSLPCSAVINHNHQSGPLNSKWRYLNRPIIKHHDGPPQQINASINYSFLGSWISWKVIWTINSPYQFHPFWPASRPTPLVEWRCTSHQNNRPKMFFPVRQPIFDALYMIFMCFRSYEPKFTLKYLFIFKIPDNQNDF